MELERIDEVRARIPRDERRGMRTDVIVYASDRLISPDSQGPLARAGRERGHAARHRRPEPGHAGHPSGVRIPHRRRGGDGLGTRRRLARRRRLRHQLRRAAGAHVASADRGAPAAARTWSTRFFATCLAAPAATGLSASANKQLERGARQGRAVDGGKRLRRAARRRVLRRARLSGGRRSGARFRRAPRSADGRSWARWAAATISSRFSASKACTMPRPRGPWASRRTGRGADPLRLARAGPPGLHRLPGRRWAPP